MKILNNIEIIDLALRYKDVLILGDLQLGYEQYLNDRGVMVPRFQTQDTIERLKEILSQAKGVKTIVFNGDIKHEFGRISVQEWKAVQQLIEELLDHYELIMVKGNHDMLLAQIIKKYKEAISLVDSYSVDNILITHGDKIHPAAREIIIIGHEHPAVSFPERPDQVFKCFLKGDWQGHTIIAMPSFTTLTIGSDVRKMRFLSPYFKEIDIDACEIYVVEDQVYYFGTLEDLSKL